MRGRVSICYNAHNLPVSMTGADGIVTKYTYNDFGSVTRIERLDGSETLTSVSFFNDMLGTTVGARSKGGRYSAAALTAFGENHLTT